MVETRYNDPMLKLSLDDLFGPEVVAAFQAHWTSNPATAAAQAEWAVRLIIAPQGERERFVARFVLALVGPEPDGLAWMEALAKGSFNLRDNVTYAIGRIGESPSKFIKRQRERISQLADHPKARGREEEYRNAYNDALRLVVASTLLMEMRKGVAAKAAIGAGWPLMAGVKTHCTADEKRALLWFGNDAELHRRLAEAAREVLTAFQAERPAEAVPRRVDPDRGLPRGTDINAFFQLKSEASTGIEPREQSRRDMRIQVPGYIAQAEASPKDDQARADLRAKMLLGLVEAASGAYALMMAVRSQRRLVLRERWLDGSSAEMPADYHVQTAIWDHVQRGGFMPAAIPVEHVHYLEEDACHAFHTMGKEWFGFDSWRQAGFFQFDPDPTSLDWLDV